VQVKTLQSQQRRMLLTTRKLLQSKMLDLENDLRGTLKNFGFKVGKIGAFRGSGSGACRRLSDVESDGHTGPGGASSTTRAVQGATRAPAPAGPA